MDSQIVDKEEKTKESNQNSESSEVKSTQFDWRANLITVELLIGGLVVLWYVTSYLFFKGKFAYFRIPSHYIDLSISKLIEPSIYYFACVLFSLFVLRIFPSRKGQVIYVYGIQIVFYISVLLVTVGKGIGLKTQLFLSLFIIFLATLHRHMFGRFILWVLGKIEELVRYIFLGSTDTEFNPRSYQMFNVIIWVIIISFGSYLTGNAVFKNQLYYYVIQQEESIVRDGKQTKQITEKVVLETYENYYVVAPLDRKNKKVIPEFELIKFDKDDKESKTSSSVKEESPPIKLRYERLGELVPKF